jgi:2-polyprenyl-6-methoxyphenol hydroxylase-like FAD-dependent oxidoreductase
MNSNLPRILKKMSPKIAIVGAGPGGLTLASILVRNGITPTVFEHDGSPTARMQGGSLDLHPGTGQAALAACGLTAEFEKYARYEDQDGALCDKNGKRELEMKGQDTGRPEIDRGQIRQMLLDSLPDGVIRWGHHLVAATEDSLTFRDHTETGFDLIVGADGAWSKIRPLCCYMTPYYSGITCVQMNLQNTSVKYPAISEMVGNGTIYALGGKDGLAMSFQRNDNDVIKITASGRWPEHWLEKNGLDANDHAGIRAHLKEEFKDWDSELVRVFDEYEGDMPVLPLHMLPVGLRWPSREKVTLIGDAAHLMTPFAGEGVNLAMADAMHLANAIIANPNNIAAAIAETEPRMWEMAKVAGSLAFENGLLRYEPGGLEKWVKTIKEKLEKQGNLQLLELLEKKQ